MAYKGELQVFSKLLNCFNSSIQFFNTHVEAILQVNGISQEKYIFAEWL